MTMVHGSLFAGIGGFDCAASWMGWKNAFHCEIDKFCSKILKYHFPDAEHYEDIRTTDFTKWRGQIDVLSGGFPCQPFSLAGRRRGADDDRYLWPEMLRAIREIQPAWVVGENVAGILTMVQPGEETPLAGERAMFGEDYEETELRQRYVVETVCTDLEREGYSVQPFVIPACAVGAPHRRDRVWFVAHRDDAGTEGKQQEWADGVHPAGFASDPHEHGGAPREACQGTEGGRRGYIPQPGERGDETERTDGLSGLPRASPYPECRGGGEVYHNIQPGKPDGERSDVNGSERAIADTYCKLSESGMSEKEERRHTEDKRTESSVCIPDWACFPTQPPIRQRYDGISNNVVRYIKKEVYDAIKEYIRREDLSCVRKAFQKKKIREQIGRLYEIPEPNILLEVLQRTSKTGRLEQNQNSLSSFSERTSERVLCYLRKYGTFAGSPFGQKYQEQFREQFNDTLPELSHEIALATKKIIEECESTAAWVRTQSIKAYGNAVVPQVVYEIFRAIEIAEKEI